MRAGVILVKLSVGKRWPNISRCKFWGRTKVDSLFHVCEFEKCRNGLRLRRNIYHTAVKTRSMSYAYISPHRKSLVDVFQENQLLYASYIYPRCQNIRISSRLQPLQPYTSSVTHGEQNKAVIKAESKQKSGKRLKTWQNRERRKTLNKSTETDYQLPNHRTGARLRIIVFGLRSSTSSVRISIAVVRGLDAEVEGLAGSGVGNAAKRVFAGGGTVTVCVWTIVLI